MRHKNTKRLLKSGYVRKLAIFLCLFLVPVLSRAETPCPDHPRPLTVADSGLLYVGAAHPWLGEQAGAVLCLNPASGETVSYRYPLLTTDNVTIDTFIPTALAMNNETDRLYAAYRRGETGTDGILVLNPVRWEKFSLSAKQSDANWGAIGGIIFLPESNRLRVIHSRIEDLVMETERTGTRVTCSIVRMVSDVTLDQNGYPIQALATVRWTDEQVVDEQRPGSVSKADVQSWLMDTRLIRRAVATGPDQCWYWMGNRCYQLDLDAGETRILSGVGLHRAVDMAVIDEQVVVLTEEGSRCRITCYNLNGQTTGDPLELDVSSAAGIACALDGEIFVSSESGNYVLGHGEEENRRYYLCSAGWPPDRDTLSIRIMTPAEGARTAAGTITVTGEVSEPGAHVTVNGTPAAVSGTYFTADISLGVGSNTITAEAELDGRITRATVHVIREAVLTVSISDPQDGLETTASEISVSGTISVSGAVVRVNGRTATVSGTSFQLDNVALNAGANTVTAEASTAIQNAAHTITVIRRTDEPLQVTISEPQTGIGVGDPSIRVSGTVSLPGTAVQINGRPADVTGTDYTVLLTLADGENLIRADATLGSMAASATVIVVLDRLAPDVMFTNVTDGMLLGESTIRVTGMVTDNTDDTPLFRFNGTDVTLADSHFVIDMDDLTDGDNGFAYEATDRYGNTATGQLTLAVDTQPPVLNVQAPGWVFRGDEETLRVTASDEREMADLQVWLNGERVASGQTYDLDIPVQVLPDNPVDHVTVRALARDAAGNESRFEQPVPVYERAYCYLNVLDDSTGHPVTDPVQALNIRNGLFTKGAATKAESTSRVGILTDSVGGALLSVTVDGYTEVRRMAGIFMEDNRLFDARLTTLNPNILTVTPDGGSFQPTDVLQVDVPAGAVSAETAVRITHVSPQGLINFLPGGWSPVLALDVATDGTYVGTFDQPFTCTMGDLDLVEPDDRLRLAMFDPDRNEWIAGDPVPIQDRSLSFQLSGAGRVVVAIADRDRDVPQAVSGEPLPGLPTPLNLPDVSARSWTDPETAAVSEDVQATGYLQLDNDGLRLPSGTRVRATFQERIHYVGSGEQVGDPLIQDLVLYSWPGMADLSGVLGADFPVDPLAPVSPETVSRGEVDVTFFRRDETGTGRVVTPDHAWTLETAGGIRLSIPEQGVLSDGYVELREEAVTLPLTDDVMTDTPFVLTIAETVFTANPVISTGWTGTTQTDGTWLFCRILDADAASRLKFVGFANWQEDAETGRSRLVADLHDPDTPVLASGRYVFVHLNDSAALLAGTVTLDGIAVDHALVYGMDTPFGDRSDADGHYRVVLPADRSITITARSREQDAGCTAGIKLAPDENRMLDLALNREGLQLVQVVPEPGLLRSLTPVFDLNFATPLDDTQDLEALVSLSGVAVDITAEGQLLTVRPTSGLTPDTAYTLTIQGGDAGLRDIFGNTLTSTLELTYTSPVDTRLDFDFADIRIAQLPDDGSPGYRKLRVYTEAGVLPVGTMVEMENLDTLAWFSETIGSDGTLDKQIDGYPGDRVQLEVTLPDGRSHVRTITRCALPVDPGEPSRFYVDSEGGTITGDGGIQLSIPRGALDRAVELTLAMNTETAHAAVEQQFPVPAEVDAQALASFRLHTDREVDVRAPLTVKIPVDDDGTGADYQLIDYREGMTIPRVDPATGLPMRDGVTGQLITDTINVRIIRGAAEIQANGTSPAPPTKTNTKAAISTALARINSIGFSSGSTSGVMRYMNTSEITGALKSADTGDYVSGFVLAGPSLYNLSFAAPATTGRFQFHYPGGSGANHVVGIQGVTGRAGIGQLSSSGTYDTVGIAYYVYSIYIAPAPPVVVQDTTAPTFSLEETVLNPSGTPDNELQQQYESSGVLPLTATMRLALTDLADDTDPAPTVSVRANGAAIPVHRDGITCTVDIDGPADGLPGSVSVEINASDASGNTASRYREYWFGVTGGQSLAGPPKVLLDACRPRDGATGLPVTLEADIVFSEPVDIDSPQMRFTLYESYLDNWVTVDGITVRANPIAPDGDMAAMFHLELDGALSFDTDYMLEISGLVDDENELMDQDAAPGLSGGRDGEAGTPARIRFTTTLPSERDLDTDGISVADIQFMDDLAFVVQMTRVGNTGAERSLLDVYDLSESATLRAPLHRVELMGQPRAVAVQRFNRNGDAGTSSGYLLAVMRRTSRDRNSTITLIELTRSGNGFTHREVGLTTHTLSYEAGNGAGPSYSLEFRGDLLYAGIANGSILTDNATGREFTPYTGIRIYSVNAIKEAYGDLSALDRTWIDRGPGVSFGLADFIKTPGYCWDLDVTDTAGEVPGRWAIVGDGSRFNEVLGADLSEIRELPESFDPSAMMEADDRITLRQEMNGTAPYMVEVREGFHYTETGPGGVRRTINLAVLRANDLSGGPNRVYLLDATAPETGTLPVLAELTFDPDQLVGYVFIDPVQPIIGLTLPGGITRFYDIANPMAPSLIYACGEGEHPAFLARGMYDGVAFGSNADGVNVLDFNPDPFDYYGFRGVMLAQYRDVVEQETVLPDIGVTIFRNSPDVTAEPVDTEIYPRYRLLEAADVTVHAVEVDGRGTPVGSGRILVPTRTVGPLEAVRNRVMVSGLFESMDKFKEAYGGNLPGRERIFRYTVEATVHSTGLTCRRYGFIRLKPHIVVERPGDIIENGVHTRTGDLVVNRVDLELPAPQLPLVIARRFTSRGEDGGGPSGANWRLSLFPTLTRVGADKFVMTGGDFTSVLFTRNGDTFEPENGYFGSLKQEGEGQYTFTSRDGIQYKFKKLEKLYAGSAAFTEMEGEIPYFIDPYNGSITNTAPNLDRIEGYGEQIITYGYDEDSGRLATITDTVDRVIHLDYTYAGGAHRVSSLKLGEKGERYRVDYTYDPDTGDLTDVAVSGTPENGVNQAYTETYTYDDDLPHNLASLTDGNGNLTTYAYAPEYDATPLPEGRLPVKEEPVDIVNLPENLTLDVNKDDAEKKTTMSLSGVGQADRSWQFNEDGLPLHITTPLGETALSGWNERVRAAQQMELPDGTTVTRAFDEKGNVVSLSVTRDGETVSESWTYHEKTNRVTSHTGPAGTTTIDYGPDGWKYKATRFEGETMEQVDSWNRFGQPTLIYNRHNELTTVGYDERGNPSQILAADALVETRTYSELGFPVAINDNRGTDIRYTRDALGRTHTIVENEAGVGKRTIRLGLDSNGNVETETVEGTGYQVTRSFDGLNRVVAQTVEPGNGSTDVQTTTGIQYDVFGNRVSETGPDGTTRTLMPDEAGRPAAVQVGGVLTRSISYEPGSTRIAADADNLTGTTRSFDYDVYGHITMESLSDGTRTLTRSRSFDENGRLAAETDINGVTTRYRYDATGRVIREIRGNGLEEVETTYDDDTHERTVINHRTGLVSRVRANILSEPVRIEQNVDGQPRITEIAYQPTGASLVRQVRRSNGTGLTVEETPAGRPLLERTAGGIVTRYRYGTAGLTRTVTEEAYGNGDITRTRIVRTDGLGRPVEETAPRGFVTRYGYDSATRTTTVEQPEGRTIVTRRDPWNRPVSTRVNDTLLETVSYTTGANRVATTNRFGGTTTVERDPAGRTVRTVRATATGSAARTIQHNGLTTTLIDEAGTAITTERDALYRPVRINRGSVTTTFAYDPATRTVTETTGERSIRRTLNEAGELTALHHDSVPVLSVERDWLNRHTAVTRYANKPVTTETWRDANGFVQREIRGGATFTYVRNRSGLPLTVTGAGRTVQSVYNADDLPTQVTARGVTTAYGYDGLGRVTSRTVGTRTWTYGWNHLNERTAVTSPGGVHSLTIDRPDIHTEIWTHGGAQTTFTCDDLGRTIGIERPDGTLRTIAYDGLDRPVSMTDFDGREVNYGYTAEGWLEREERGTSVRTYEYNALGKPVRVSTDGIDSILTYDEQGRLTARTFENGRTVGYRYYPSGARERVIDSLGGVVRYSYDRQGRIDTLTDGGGRVLADYAYDPDTGLPLEIIHGADALGTPHSLYDYDQEGRITGINTTADGTDLITENYVYNTYGEMQTRTMARGDLSFTETYGYTDDGLLNDVERMDGSGTLIDHATYGYDERGNRISETHDGANPRTIAYTVNNMNQLLDQTVTMPDGTDYATTFAYDAGGRLQHITAETAEGAEETTYGYDNFGRRSSAVGPFGEVAYRYAFDGKRISTTMNGIIEDRTWDENELLETLSGTGTRISRMAQGLNGRALAYVDGSGNWRSLITDMQGSVIGSLDNTTIATSTVYDPFGGITNQAGDATPIDWLARSRDAATGDVDLVNRWYNPSQGRFTSTDQYRFVDPQMPYSLNLYQYGYSNPMMYMDREGLNPFLSGLGGFWSNMSSFDKQLILQQASLEAFDIWDSGRLQAQRGIVEGAKIWNSGRIQAQRGIAEGARIWNEGRIQAQYLSLQYSIARANSAIDMNTFGCLQCMSELGSSYSRWAKRVGLPLRFSDRANELLGNSGSVSDLLERRNVFADHLEGNFNNLWVLTPEVGLKYQNDVAGLVDEFENTPNMYAEVQKADDAILFINGINNRISDIAAAGIELSIETKKPVILFWNPTHGSILDLLHCATTDKLRLRQDLSRRLSKTLSSYFDSPFARGGDRNLQLLAHSEGTMISDRAIIDLHPKHREHLDVVYFGSPEYTGPSDLGVRSFLNVVNIYDLVAVLGGRMQNSPSNLYLAENMFGLGQGRGSNFVEANHSFINIYLPFYVKYIGFTKRGAARP